MQTVFPIVREATNLKRSKSKSGRSLSLSPRKRPRLSFTNREILDLAGRISVLGWNGKCNGCLEKQDKVATGTNSGFCSQELWVLPSFEPNGTFCGSKWKGHPPVWSAMHINPICTCCHDAPHFLMQTVAANDRNGKPHLRDEHLG